MTTNLSAELGRASETVAGFPLESHVPFGSITSFTVSGLQAIQATRGPAGPRSKAAWQIEIEKWVKAGWRFNLDLALTTAAAQADLDYGEWGHLWDSWQSEDRPFNLRKGETLVFVGKNMGKLEPQDRAVLPRSLGALGAL